MTFSGQDKAQRLRVCNEIIQLLRQNVDSASVISLTIVAKRSAHV